MRDAVARIRFSGPTGKYFVSWSGKTTSGCVAFDTYAEAREWALANIRIVNDDD